MSKQAEAGGDKDKKGKKAKKGKDQSAGPAGPSVAAHPRASYQVRRAKGWGGLAAFAIVAYLSHKAGVPTFQAGLRAIAAGIAGYMLAWTCALTVWRHLVQAELRAAADRVAEPNPDFIPARAPAPAPRPGAAPAGEPAAAGPAS